MFTKDPHNTWSNGWEKKNPEPDLEFQLWEDNKYHAHWGDILLHIDWHKRRWEAFKKDFSLGQEEETEACPQDDKREQSVEPEVNPDAHKNYSNNL